MQSLAIYPEHRRAEDVGLQYQAAAAEPHKPDGRQIEVPENTFLRFLKQRAPRTQFFVLHLEFRAIDLELLLSGPLVWRLVP